MVCIFFEIISFLFGPNITQNLFIRQNLLDGFIFLIILSYEDSPFFSPSAFLFSGLVLLLETGSLSSLLNIEVSSERKNDAFSSFYFLPLS